jgi:hypothetical protein
MVRACATGTMSHILLTLKNSELADMKFIVDNIQSVLLITGLLTGTVLLAALLPQTALNMMFGAELPGPLAEVLVRNWGLLVGGVGLMLIYAAFNPAVRRLVVTVAIISKLAFIGLNLAYGQMYLAKTAPSLVFDAIVVAVFALYLIAVARAD